MARFPVPGLGARRILVYDVTGSGRTMLLLTRPAQARRYLGHVSQAQHA